MNCGTYNQPLKYFKFIVVVVVKRNALLGPTQCPSGANSMPFWGQRNAPNGGHARRGQRGGGETQCPEGTNAMPRPSVKRNALLGPTQCQGQRGETQCQGQAQCPEGTNVERGETQCAMPFWGQRNAPKGPSAKLKAATCQRDNFWGGAINNNKAPGTSRKANKRDKYI
jgi:hypothetical protein